MYFALRRRCHIRACAGKKRMEREVCREEGKTGARKEEKVRSEKVGDGLLLKPTC